MVVARVCVTHAIVSIFRLETEAAFNCTRREASRGRAIGSRRKRKPRNLHLNRSNTESKLSRRYTRRIDSRAWQKLASKPFQFTLEM